MNEAHLRAVFLMLAGENVAAVSAQSGICRTSLYKLLNETVPHFAAKFPEDFQLSA